MARIREIDPDHLPLAAEYQIWHVYVISETDGDEVCCKIGHARHASWRFSDLQGGNRRRLDLALVFECKGKDTARWMEKRLHERFADYRIRGEWFRVKPVNVQVAARHIISEALGENL